MTQDVAAGFRQRLDKWLWFARIVKSRTLAAGFVANGHVRVNSARVTTPAHALKPDDVVTIALERDVRVLKVRGAGVRRGPYPEARLLYEDLTPPPEPAPDRVAPAGRDHGAGRPTGKDRRELAKRGLL